MRMMCCQPPVQCANLHPRPVGWIMDGELEMYADARWPDGDEQAGHFQSPGEAETPLQTSCLATCAFVLARAIDLPEPDAASSSWSSALSSLVGVKYSYSRFSVYGGGYQAGTSWLMGWTIGVEGPDM
jgi:hypothetical protein